MSNIEAIVIVYQQTRPPYKHRVVYGLCGSGVWPKKGEKHIATLDPAKWIETLLNSGQNKAIKEIEELYYPGGSK